MSNLTSTISGSWWTSKRRLNLETAKSIDWLSRFISTHCRGFIKLLYNFFVALNLFIWIEHCIHSKNRIWYLLKSIKLIHCYKRWGKRKHHYFFPLFLCSFRYKFPSTDLFAALNYRMLVLWQALREVRANANWKALCMWMPSTRKKEGWASGITAQLEQESKTQQGTLNKQLLLAFYICLVGFDFFLSSTFELIFQSSTWN